MVKALIRIKFISTFLFLLAVNVSQAQESMMQDISLPFLDKLVVAAKANYPKMVYYQHMQDAAKYKIQYAKLDWFNIFNFAYFPSNNAAALSPNAANSYQLGFSTSIGTILQKPVNVKLAREDYKVAQDNQAEYNLNIEAIVKQRYYAYIQQLTLLNWRTKDLENNGMIMKELKDKFEKGEEIFDNYDRAITLYSNSVQAKITTEGAYLTAKSSLEEIIGEPIDSVK